MSGNMNKAQAVAHLIIYGFFVPAGVFLLLIPIWGTMWWFNVDWPWWITAASALTVLRYRNLLRQEQRLRKETDDLISESLKERRKRDARFRARIRALNEKLPEADRDNEDMNLRPNGAKTIYL